MKLHDVVLYLLVIIVVFLFICLQTSCTPELYDFLEPGPFFQPYDPPKPPPL